MMSVSEALLRIAHARVSTARALVLHPESAIHAAADRHVKTIAIAIRYGLAIAKLAIDDYHKPDPDRIAGVIENALQRLLPPLMMRAVVDGGIVGAQILRQRLRKTAGKPAGGLDPSLTVVPIASPGLRSDGRSRVAGGAGSRKRGQKKRLRTLAGPTFRFDGLSPKASEWAKKHAGEMAQSISKTTRKKIADAVSQGLDAELTADEVRALIADAIGDEDRADRIARHETMTAVSEGQREAWDQAIDEGYLTGDEKRVWIAVGDGKVCSICEDLDETEADLNGEYEGGIPGPPAHVSCRCTEGLV